jgi:hypothetical protein
MRDPTGGKRAIWVMAGAMLLLCGCADMSQVFEYNFNDLSKPFFRDAKMEGPPRVENCGIIAISTPTQYQCNGKKYTTVELADIRQGKALPPPGFHPMVPRSGFQRPPASALHPNSGSGTQP